MRFEVIFYFAIKILKIGFRLVKYKNRFL